MRPSHLLKYALAALLLAGSTLGVSAQQGAVPVIVVMRDDVPFANYRASYRADERAACSIGSAKTCARSS